MNTSTVILLEIGGVFAIVFIVITALAYVTLP